MSARMAGDDPGVRLLIAASLVILTGLAWAWTVAMAAMPECHHIGLSAFVLMLAYAVCRIIALNS